MGTLDAVHPYTASEEPMKTYPKRAEQQRRWRERNREKYRRHDRIYARLGRGVYRRAWLDLLAGIGGHCLACGTTEDVCADHVIPIAKGGGNSPINLQPLCRRCNLAKTGRATDYRSPAILALAEVVARQHGIAEPASPHESDPVVVRGRQGCSEPGCDRKHYATGICRMHYSRAQRATARRA